MSMNNGSRIANGGTAVGGTAVGESDRGNSRQVCHGLSSQRKSGYEGDLEGFHQFQE